MTPISSISPAAGGASALTSGTALIGSASAALDRDAVEIANPDAADLTSPLLDLSQSEFMAEAGAAVVKTADGMLGTLLDVFA
jgi:hypothetical protein